jgi:histidine phosphotransfer protein HptB
VITDTVIDHAKLNALRSELGAHFPRILGYFAEDGVKSLSAIEDAVRARDAVAIVRPAHTLKGEALQFGAQVLGEEAEWIETAAREAVETHSFPHGMVEHSARLRPLFEEALSALQSTVAATIAPPVAIIRRAPGGFGRKVG